MERKQYISPITNQRQTLLPERPIADSPVEGMRNGGVIIEYEGEDKTDDGLWADSKSREEGPVENSLW